MHSRLVQSHAAGLLCSLGCSTASGCVEEALSGVWSYALALYCDNCVVLYAQIDDLTFVMSQEEIDQVGLHVAADNEAVHEATAQLLHALAAL